MKSKFLYALVTSSVIFFSGAVQSQARDYISIVGSSTVYPFSTVVAERFGKTTTFNTPKVESTGSGGGFKLFCSGLGPNTPDITNSSRRIKQSEFDLCEKNGVMVIVEVKIGYDGIVFANSKKASPIDVSRVELFLVLAKEVPNPNGSANLVANPYSLWSDIRSDLPNEPIRVLGPPPTSGTRDAFLELVMEEGCNHYPWIKSMDKNTYKEICHTIREDGAYIEAGENDNLIVQKLNADVHTFGIFGFSFLDQNMDVIQGSLIDGKEPTFENISSGEYSISRPLYFYVKGQHSEAIKGLREFLESFVSDAAWGPDGYLADKGMIPMGEEERKLYGENAKLFRPLLKL